MIHLTSEATSHLQKVRKERGLDETHAARFVGRGGRIGLTFAASPEPGDQVVNDTAMPVYVAHEIAKALADSVIDARDDDGPPHLVLRRQRRPAPIAP